MIIITKCKHISEKKREKTNEKAFKKGALSVTNLPLGWYE
jgi:hypothetical protein